MMLTLTNISKRYDETQVLQPIDLTIKQGDIVCLLGSSGCGKTTLLRLIAGLEQVDTGEVWCDGDLITHVPPHQRGFGLMFQEYALFPHKNVAQNIAFGLEMRRIPEPEIAVNRMLELVGLTGFEERDINSLSGGERQRVALARSLAPGPRLLMLDEPLGALDRALRERLMLEIRTILKQVGLTAIYVTHDQLEAFAVADQIVVLNQGCIEQVATPETVYRHPATPYIARFLGFKNLFTVEWVGEQSLRTPFGQWQVEQTQPKESTQAIMLIRPEAAHISPMKHGIKLAGTIKQVLFKGRFYQITMLIDGQRLTFELNLSQAPSLGDEQTVWISPTAIQIFQSR